MNKPPSFAVEDAKRLLLRARPDEHFFHFTDTLNLYRGCNHGCVYCDSLSECYHIENFHQVRVKRDALGMLKRELSARRAPGVVMMGAASDPYNALEERLRVTRGALELLLQHGFGVGMSTKSALIARDRDVLARFRGVAPCWTAFSITTGEDALAGLLEPYAAPPSRRFEAMRALADAGVLTGTWLNPMLPFLTDGEENVLDVARRTRENGGRFVLCHFGMTLRAGSRESFYRALDSHPRFAGVKQRYAAAFGLDYLCPSPWAEERLGLLTAECERLGLRYTYEQVNRLAREACPRQLRMW